MVRAAIGGSCTAFYTVPTERFSTDRIVVKAWRCVAQTCMAFGLDLVFDGVEVSSIMLPAHLEMTAIQTFCGCALL